VEASSTDDKTIMSIYIRHGIKNDYTTFSITEPVAIMVSGVNNTITDYDLDFSRNTVTLTVTQVVFQIHYNTTPIQTITINNPTNAQTTNKLSVMYLDTTKSGGNQFNANIFIYDQINEEILPDKSGLVGVEHIHYSHRNSLSFTYDRNPLSKAYIPLGEGSIYYQACLWGGTQKAFIELSQTIQEWTNEDLNNNIEPIWLDESYLNKYFLINPPKTLPSTFAFPTNMPLFSNSSLPKILQLEKKDYIFDENFRFL
jgi:hypothetical protein